MIAELKLAIAAGRVAYKAGKALEPHVRASIAMHKAAELMNEAARLQREIEDAVDDNAKKD